MGVKLWIPVPYTPGPHCLHVFAADIAGNKMGPIDLKFRVG